MSQPLLTEAQFETMRLYLILATVVYRIFLMPKYLQVGPAVFLSTFMRGGTLCLNQKKKIFHCSRVCVSNLCSKVPGNICQVFDGFACV